MPNATQEIRDLRNELKELRASVASNVKSGNGQYRAARDEILHLADDVSENAREVAHNVGAGLRTAWARGRTAAVDGYNVYENSVVRHPLTATAVAVGFGVVIGALLRRR